MAVALSWLVSVPELGLRLVAGRLEDVEVTWAHSIELVDPSPWLSGGELVLTTGIRFPRGRSEQAAYVDRLVAKDVAALAFGVGLRFSAVPRGLIDRCDAVGLPLLEIPLPTPFVAITQAIADRLAEDRERGLQQTIRAQQELTRTTLRDGLPGLATRLAKELGSPVAVVDEYGMVAAASDLARELAERAQELVRDHLAALTPAAPGTSTDGGTGAARTAGPLSPDPAIEIQPLLGRTARRGWLALEHREPAGAGARLLLNHAVSLATLHLDRPREVEEARVRVGASILSILLDRAPAPAEVTAHLRHFGFEEDDRVRMLCLSRGEPSALETLVQARLSSPGLPHVIARSGADLVIMVRAGDAAQSIERLEHGLAAHGSPRTTIGVSGPLSQDHAAAGLLPARRAAHSAALEGKRVEWFDTLTLERILADDVVRQHVAAMVRSMLEPLLADTSAVEQDLIGTLRAYLDHNGSWETAARALGIHRHTLRNRIARIERLTGTRLEVAANRVVMLLALATLDGTSVPSGTGPMDETPQ